MTLAGLQRPKRALGNPWFWSGVTRMRLPRAGGPDGARALRQMLYDQPQLARAHTDAFALTGERRHAAVARGVLDYLLRDLAAPGGGFFSAEVRNPTAPMPAALVAPSCAARPRPTAAAS